MSDRHAALWLARRFPLAGRLYTGTPSRSAVQSRGSAGTVWSPAAATGTSATGTSVTLVLFSSSPGSMAWLASSIATALPATVVVAKTPDDPHSTLRTVQSELEPDASRLGVIGEGTAASAAIVAASAGQRLALVSPEFPSSRNRSGMPSLDGVPPTLLQFARNGASGGVIRDLETTMRDAGIAVRATDYTGIADGWARFPKAVRRSDRALDDLLAFLRRGFGTESTFQVIPGWDLH